MGQKSLRTGLVFDGGGENHLKNQFGWRAVKTPGCGMCAAHPVPSWGRCGLSLSPRGPVPDSGWRDRLFHTGLGRRTANCRWEEERM